MISQVQAQGETRFIVLDDQVYVDKLISRHEMRERAQHHYLLHDAQAMSARSQCMRMWYILLRNNAAKRRSQWA